MKPVVAIVGRPNVGKSTLFNKLVGKRISIVEDTPGVTRDRIYSDCEWRNKSFILIDTGGIEPSSEDIILSQMKAQADLAIQSADVIIFMTDIKTGLTASDKEVCTMLLKSSKPIILCVNKADNIGDTPMEFYEFYNLGLGDPIAVSSVHGHGTGDLLDAVFEKIESFGEDDYDEDTVKVAVIGKPNAGKSSLINSILGENRVIVSDIPGTTRDAIDTYVENEYGKYVFIDTAGLRRKSKVDESVEKYSVMRSLLAIERADVCLIMIDGKEGVTDQDTKIAGYAHEGGKASIFVVNKWDIVEKNDKTMYKFKQDIAEQFAYMPYAPALFISAKTGLRIDKLFPEINFVNEQNNLRIPTGALNDVLNEAVMKVQPPTDKGKRLKILYMTQVSTKPPTFVFFVNKAELFHFSYQRYIENQLRKVFDLSGTPIRFIIRERGENANTK